MHIMFYNNNFVKLFDDVHQFQYVLNNVTPLTYIANDFSPYSMMKRISFECPCKRSINSTDFTLNTEYVLVYFNNIYQLHSSLNIFTPCTSQSTDKQIDRKTEFIKLPAVKIV